MNMVGIRHGWRIAGWSLAGAILAAPLVAMRFGNGVNWTLSDFIVAGALLGITGLAFEGIVATSSNRIFRAAAALGLLTALVSIWATLAVGIIGDEGNPLNAVYPAVIAIAAAGVWVSRLEAKGMARAIGATAVAQALVTVFALPAGLATFVINVILVTCWLLVAVLFRSTARTELFRR
ncbi:hypothetical protein GCM10007989_23630 [Devosia pacifica]|uniref:Uncharacterized protein n=1 Tax=Devosia pacifica TaxID=1335967 RepID=A0A918S910_9HYPH|nr:hypothetical protein [Devosia pacifica]GHA27076.1 hypothetical protein GCM10007989_23630 [Devosia pacifica]